MTVAALGAAALLWPNQPGAIAVAGGTAGAVGSALLSRQQERRSQQQALLHIRNAVEASLTSPAITALLHPPPSLDAQTFQQSLEENLSSLLAASLVPVEQSLQQTQQELSEALTRLGRQQQSVQDQMKGVKQQLQTLDQQLLILQASLRTTEATASLDLAAETPLAATPVPRAEAAPAKLLTAVQPKPLPEMPEPREAIAWLKEHQVIVKNHRKLGGSALDRGLDEVAFYLGEHYDTLKAFHRQIMNHARVGKQFFFPLYHRSQEDIRINTTFGSLLRKYGCVANYDYSDNEKIINLTPHRREEFTRFFFGDWFERFIHHQTASFLKTHGYHYEVISNAEVIFPNQDEYELDLFYLVQGHPLWIECKAGKSFDQYIEQYSNRGAILGVPKDSALMVVLNLPETQAEARTEMWSITVANQDTLIPRLRVALASLPAVAAQTNSPGTGAIATSPPPSSPLGASVSTPLSQAKLKPARQHRRTILETLIQRLQALPLPLSCYDIKNDLIQTLTDPNRLGGPINATPINDVLRTLLIGDCFLDAAGQPVKSFHVPIAALTTQNVSELEARCIQTYATKVLSIDPTYLDDADNTARFEAQVGGKISDPAMIEQIKTNLRQATSGSSEPAA